MWILSIAMLCLFFCLWAIARHFSAANFGLFHAFADELLVVKKTRILAVTALLLCLAVEYVLTLINPQYIADWPINGLVSFLSLLVFMYTYLPGIRISILVWVVRISYVLICGLYLYKAYINALMPGISIQVCILFVYSLLVFSEMKSFVFFVCYLFVASGLAVYFSDASQDNKLIFLSALAQAVLMLMMFTVVESRKVSRIFFSDTILNNSRQFVYVLDLHGKVVYVNNYMSSELGASVEDLLNEGFWEKTGWDAQKQHHYKQARVQNIHLNVTGKHQETLFNRHDRREMVIEWSETPLESRYLLMLGNEITDEVLQKVELEKLSLVAKSVTNGVVITDFQHRIEWANDSFLNLMEYTLPEIIGKRPIDVFSGPKTDGITVKRIKQEGLVNDTEIAQYTKSGALKWLLVNNSLLKDEAGKIIKQVEIITDITERKRLERRFSYILQNAGDVIYTSNIHGEFDFINDTVTTILGYEPKELLGWHFTRLIHVEDRERVEKFYFNCFKKKINDTYLEFRVLSKQQKVVWVSQTVNFIFNEAGDIEGLQAIVRDITLVKGAELEKIRKYERQQQYADVLTKLWLKPYETYGSLDDLLLQQCRLMAETLGIWRVGFWFLDGDKMWRKCVYPPEGNGIPFGVTELLRDEFPIYFAAVASGQVLKVDDIATHPATVEFNGDYEEDADVTAMMDMPILLDGKLIGILCCEEVGGVREWSEEEEVFLKGMADYTAINLEAEKRRAVERAIKESETNFRQLNETIDDVFWLYDLVQHRILYVSPSSEKILGIQPQEFYKTDNYWVNYILDEDKPMILNAHRLIEERGYYEVEYRIRKSDGKIHWIYEKSFGIKDDSGRFVKSSGLCSDITSRKESQALIERLSLVAEKTTNSIIITNHQEEIIWVNHAFEKLTGFQFSEVLGKNPSRLLQGPETTDESRAAIREILSNNRSGHVDLVNYNKEGKAYWTSLQIDPVFDANGSCIYYISVESDITTQKLAAIALKESKEKLDEYARSLEFQDAAKGQLIQSQSVDETIENLLEFLRHELQNVCYLSMFVLDEKKQNFIGKRFVDGELERETINIRHTKSYSTISAGDVYIERDLRGSGLISESDEYLITIGTQSYIILPLMSFNEFIGALVVAFSAPYQLTPREEGSLRDLMALLSVSARQLMLRDKIFEHNKDLNDSLKYAQNIQASILPFNSDCQAVQDTFILYLPKAHVSGDFYWIEEVGDYQFMVVGDCTGHGVPGAFLTLLANNLLQKNIVENRLTSPAAILQNIDREIYTILNRSSDRLVRDGMELGISIVNSKTQTLTFAGAGLGLTYFADGGEPVIIRGNPVPIGDYKSEQIAFDETVLPLGGSMQFFMNSDGYQDQLGGTNNKRLSKKVFLAYLAEIRHMPAPEQQAILLSRLKAHQRDYSQTDDITVLGFKVTL